MKIILETERTIIREYELFDVEELVSIASKKFVTDWLPDWLECDKWALPWIQGKVGIGYFIDENYKNKGYITEAMRSFCNYIFERYEYEYIIATIQPKNLPSIAVVNKLGFNYLSTIEIKDNGQTEVLPFNYYRLYNNN